MNKQLKKQEEDKNDSFYRLGKSEHLMKTNGQKWAEQKKS